MIAIFSIYEGSPVGFLHRDSPLVPFFLIPIIRQPKCCDPKCSRYQGGILGCIKPLGQRFKHVQGLHMPRTPIEENPPHVYQMPITLAKTGIPAPYTWNSLPADIRLSENIFTFKKKRHLNTHLFKLTLVLLCCIKRLCIFRPKGAILIPYYYYYYYLNFNII